MKQMNPSFDPYDLPLDEKIKLVRESDGLLIDILVGEEINNLDLQGCTSLKELPEGLEVKHLNLRECTSLEKLPEGLEVNYLYLRGCASLKKLPSKLEVRCLGLEGCTSLEKLPSRLKIFDWIDIKGSGIKEVSHHLKDKLLK